MSKVSVLLMSLGLVVSSSSVWADRAGGDRSDVGITARVKTELVRNTETKARQINVETQDGVVQLSGFVDSEGAKRAAEETAMGVSGVRQVRNDLVVREGERSIGRATDDAVIAAKVKSQLAGESGLETASDVDVEVRGGVVQLSGFVSTHDDKSDAESVTRNVSGVTDVRNDIEVERAR